MTDHIVKAYDRELDQLHLKISEMGGIAEKMLLDSMDALSSLDPHLSEKVIARDQRLDELRREVEELVVITIARRQPVAVDLRVVIGALHTASDLERVGDLAKNIAKRTIKIVADARAPRISAGLRHMADLAALQLKDVLNAYVERDADKAKTVWSRDADIDALDDSVFRELLTFMMEDPRNITDCTHLLFCSKNIERIGDHATNIAETIHYLATGESLPLNRPKGPSPA